MTQHRLQPRVAAVMIDGTPVQSRTISAISQILLITSTRNHHATLAGVVAVVAAVVSIVHSFSKDGRAAVIKAGGMVWLCLADRCTVEVVVAVGGLRHSEVLLQVR
eukprot:COSAG06_NODE_1812_length_8310_cov_12.407259_8_plen_106_part_00